MADFRFGELRERTLHKQLKGLYRPDDGEVEWKVAGSVADLWSPSAGVIEIQTRNLAKLRPKLAAYLDAGLKVTVVHPLACRRTLVTLNADHSEVLTRRKSPKADRIEASFRELGALAEFFLAPGFRLVVPLIHETEHRRDDGQGSWRRQGKSKVDRVLEGIAEERTFATAEDWAGLLPLDWEGPSTAADLGRLLKLTDNQAQAFTAALGKIGVIEVEGKRGRARLWVRAQRKNAES